MREEKRKSLAVSANTEVEEEEESEPTNDEPTGEPKGYANINYSDSVTVVPVYANDNMEAFFKRAISLVGIPADKASNLVLVNSDGAQKLRMEDIEELDLLMGLSLVTK